MMVGAVGKIRRKNLMQRGMWAGFVACLAGGVLFAQAPQPGNIQGRVRKPKPPEAQQVGERGPNWQTVTNLVPVANETDGWQYQTNTYVHLEPGLNYRNAQGEWVEAKAEFELLTQGAVARQGQHQVTLPANLNGNQPVSLVQPDGQVLTSRPHGLAYYDTATGEAVLLAEIKDCQGYQIAPNQILYTDAFDDIQADVRYTYTKGGFEQDIVLKQAPPAPEKYGLNSATTRLEVWSEFLNAPVPQRQVSVLKPGSVVAGRDESFTDDQLDFGAMKMGAGRAFQAGASDESSVPVGKSWIQDQGRTFLIEAVELPTVQPDLQVLPQTPGGAVLKRKPSKRETALRQLPVPAKAAKRQQAAIRPATKELLSALIGPALVLDYSIVSGPTLTANYVFKGDTTYYISGAVSTTQSPTAATTFEGGTVIKYANTNSASLTVNTPIVWQGSLYRPVVLTAKDDNTVGEVIGSGTPTGTYAVTALYLDGRSSPTGSGTSFSLAHLRIGYAQTAITLNQQSANSLKHVQLVNCTTGINALSAGVYVGNILFSGVTTCFTGTTPLASTVEHATVETATTFCGSAYGATLTARNCLLYSVGTSGSYSNGGNNQTAPSNPFQTVKGGFHYLANGSAYRDAGNTSINSTLATELKSLTTYPPVELTTGFTLDTVLAPQAQRDTDTPDLGFHYACLDYLWSNLTLSSGKKLFLTNGVAVGFYGTLGLTANGTFVSWGTPTALNRLTLLSTVQEKLQGIIANTATFSLRTASSANVPATFRFTDISFMAASSSGREISLYSNPIGDVTMADCQLRGVNWGHMGDFYLHLFTLKNCLCERSSFTFAQGTSYASMTNLAITLQNDLFYRCNLSLIHGGSAYGAWNLYDNLFDNCASAYGGGLSLSEIGYPTGSTLSTLGYNGFIGTTAIGTTGNKTSLTEDFQSGPLGNYYYPTTVVAGSLANLINNGSQTAAAAGLYHYTTTQNQTKEGLDTSGPTVGQVDIGFHYVALDSGGKPTDADGDGVPDYLEDPSGPSVNDPPLIVSPVASVTVRRNQKSSQIPLWVWDDQTPLNQLVISVSSSSATLLPTNNVMIEGSGANRSFWFKPATGQYGNCRLTLTVKDTGIPILSSSTSFDIYLKSPPILTLASAALPVAIGALAPTLVDPAATFTDPDTTTWNGSVIRIPATKGDLLSLVGNSLITTSGANVVSVSGSVTVGTFTGGWGTDLVITLNSSATTTIIQNILRAIGYRAADPSDLGERRTLEVRFSEAADLAAGTITANAYRVLSLQLPRPKADAGYDLSAVLSGGVATVTLNGKVSSAGVNSQVNYRWTVVRPFDNDGSFTFDRDNFVGDGYKHLYDDADGLSPGPSTYQYYSPLPSGQRVVLGNPSGQSPTGANAGLVSVPGTATFYQPGVYRLRLESLDQKQSAMDEVQVMVRASGVSVAPSVTIRRLPPLKPSAQNVALSADVFSGSTGSLNYSWTTDPPTANVTFATPTQVTTTAVFSQPGRYKLVFSVVDPNNATLTATDSTIVTVCSDPEQPVDLMVVVDRSGSMRNTRQWCTGSTGAYFQPIGEVESACLSLIEKLDSSKHQIGLVGYAGDVELAAPLSADYEKARAAASGLWLDIQQRLWYGNMEKSIPALVNETWDIGNVDQHLVPRYQLFGGCLMWTPYHFGPNSFPPNEVNHSVFGPQDDAGALEAALAELQGPHRRPNSKPVILLVTDGYPTDPVRIGSIADRIHEAGIQLSAMLINESPLSVYDSAKATAFLSTVTTSPADVYSGGLKETQELLNDLVSGQCAARPNHPPSVALESETTVEVGSELVLRARVRDDGLPLDANGRSYGLTYHWTYCDPQGNCGDTVIGGISQVKLSNPYGQFTSATFDHLGRFKINLDVDDDPTTPGTVQASTWVNVVAVNSPCETWTEERVYVYGRMVPILPSTCFIQGTDDSGGISFSCVSAPTPYIGLAKYSRKYPFMTVAPDFDCSRGHVGPPLSFSPPPPETVWPTGSYYGPPADQQAPSDAPYGWRLKWLTRFDLLDPRWAGYKPLLDYPTPFGNDYFYAAGLLIATRTDSLQAWTVVMPDASAPAFVQGSSASVTLNATISSCYPQSDYTASWDLDVDKWWTGTAASIAATHVQNPSGPNPSVDLTFKKAGYYAVRLRLIEVGGRNRTNDQIAWVTVGNASLHIDTPSPVRVKNQIPYEDIHHSVYATAHIQATASLPGTTVTSVWTVESGPADATVTGLTANALTIDPTFDKPGKYVLRLDTTIGVARITVLVNDYPQIKMPKFNFPVPASTRGLVLKPGVTDDGLPGLPGDQLTYLWTTDEGPNDENGDPVTAQFDDPTKATPHVTFPVEGVYKLHLKVYDGAASSTSRLFSEDTLTLTVSDTGSDIILNKDVIEGDGQQLFDLIDAGIQTLSWLDSITPHQNPSWLDSGQYYVMPHGKCYVHANKKQAVYTPLADLGTFAPCDEDARVDVWDFKGRDYYGTLIQGMLRVHVHRRPFSVAELQRRPIILDQTVGQNATVQVLDLKTLDSYAPLQGGYPVLAGSPFEILSRACPGKSRLGRLVDHTPWPVQLANITELVAWDFNRGGEGKLTYGLKIEPTAAGITSIGLKFEGLPGWVTVVLKVAPTGTVNQAPAIELGDNLQALVGQEIDSYPGIWLSPNRTLPAGNVTWTAYAQNSAGGFTTPSSAAHFNTIIPLPGDPITTPGPADRAITFDAAGYYRVDLQVTDSSSATTTKSMYVTVVDDPPSSTDPTASSQAIAATILNLTADPDNVTTTQSLKFDLFAVMQLADGYVSQGSQVCVNVYDASKPSVVLTNVKVIDLKGGGAATPVTNDAGIWFNYQLAAGADALTVPLDFHKVRNGRYLVEFLARDGVLTASSGRLPLYVDAPVRFGQLNFAEEDLRIGSGDQTMTVVRAYDSTRTAGTFGPGWVYAGYDLNAQVDETRQLVDTAEIRQNGSGNVILNLPGSGQRVLFAFQGFAAKETWLSPADAPGVSLAMLDEDAARLGAYDGLDEQFDVSGYLLKLPGGTQCRLTRARADNDGWAGPIYYGPPELQSMTFPDQSVMNRTISALPAGGTSELLQYTLHGQTMPSRQISILRDPQGRIYEIYDPQSLAAGAPVPAIPAVVYDYYKVGDPCDQVDANGNFTTPTPVLAVGDPRLNNLRSVSKLITRGTSRLASTYQTTTYSYGYAGLPTALTSITGPTGQNLLKALWNSDGGITKLIDARGVPREVNYLALAEQVKTPFGNQTLAEWNLLNSTEQDLRKVTVLQNYDEDGNLFRTDTQVLAYTAPGGGFSLPAAYTYSASTFNLGKPELQTQGSTDINGASDVAMKWSRNFYDGRSRLTATQTRGVNTTVTTDDAFTRFDYDRSEVVDNGSDLMTSVQDPLGHKTYTHYDSAGRVDRVTDALGRVTRSYYRPSLLDTATDGKLSYVEDALGNRTQYTYYASTDADGQAGDVKDTITWGNVGTVSSPSYVELTRSTTFYDANGRVKATQMLRHDRDSAGNVVAAVQTIRTDYVLDGQGRVLQTLEKRSDNPYTVGAGADESQQSYVSQTIYHANGKVKAQIDRYGVETDSLYDRLGNLAQTIQLGGTDANGTTVPVVITRTVYDINNRPILQTEPHLPATGDTYPYLQPTVAPGTQTRYDGFGRVWTSQRVSGVAITLTLSAGTGTSPSSSAAYQDPASNPLFDSAKTSGATLGIITQTLNEYDALGRLTKATDLATNYRRTTYGAEPGDTVKTYANADTTALSETTYDLAGNVATTKDAGGNMTSYAYDELNRQTRVDYPALAGYPDNKTITTYDELGRRSSFIDQENKTNTYQYDGLGRLTLVTTPDHDPNGTPPVIRQTTYAYDEVGNLVVQTDAATHKTVFRFDNQGRRITRWLPGGQEERFIYDPRNAAGTGFVNAQTRVDFNGRPTTTFADVRGRTARKAPGDLLVMANGDPSTQAAASINPPGINNALKFTASANGTSYNGTNIVLLADGSLPAGADQAVASFDNVNARKVLWIRYNPGYTRASTVVSAVNALTTPSPSLTASLDTDAGGNDGTGTVTPVEAPVQWTYTPAGQRSTMVDASGTSTYIYGSGFDGSNVSVNDLGRLLVKYHSDAGAITYGYDSRGNLSSIDATRAYNPPTLVSGQYKATLNTGLTAGTTKLGYTYDYQNRLADVNNGSSTVLARNAYYPNGNLQSVTYAQAGASTTLVNGMKTDAMQHLYNYDAVNHLINLKVWNQVSGSMAYFDYNTTGRLLLRNGVRQTVAESIGTVNRTVNYTYDKCYRLIREDVPSDTGSPAYRGQIAYGTYDAVGNRTQRLISDAAGQPAGDANNLRIKVRGQDSFTYDVNDRLTAFRPYPDVGNPALISSAAAYDSNGNTLRADLSGDATGTQDQSADEQYSFEDRLLKRTTSGGTVVIVYDGDGNRIRKTVGTTVTRYLVVDRNPTGYAQVLEEWKSTGGAFTLDRSYVYGLDLISQKIGTAMNYYGYDGLGSVRLLFSGTTAAVTDTYVYDAYGILLRQTPSSGQTPNNYLYAGEQWDNDLGLYYNRARYMNPTQGRFWSMDSYEGSSSEPLSLHKYLYCQNGSVNRIDPSGHDGDLISTGVAASIQSGLQSMRAVFMPSAGRYVAKRIGNAIMMGLAGGALNGLDAAAGGGDFDEGFVSGFKAGFLFGLVPPQVWASPGGVNVLRALAAIGLFNAIESFENGNIGQGILRIITSAIPGKLSPSTPKKLYVYFSSENLASIKAEGLRTGVGGKVWASDMPPSKFNDIKLGGTTGFKPIDDFPFFKAYTKKFDCVAEIEDTSSFSPAGLTYKQLLGQFESSQTIAPSAMKIQSNGGK